MTSLLPALPKIRFELANMTIPADHRLSLRKLSGPEPSPDGFDRDAERLADPALAMPVSMEGNNLLVAFQSTLSALLLPGFFQQFLGRARDSSGFGSGDETGSVSEKCRSPLRSSMALSIAVDKFSTK